MADNDVRMSRARLYMLIDAFEKDNRDLVERCLLDHQEPSEVFSVAELKDALWRQKQEEDGTDVPLVHFLDLKPAFDALSRGKNKLPTDLRTTVSESSSAVASLVPLRNRVMHGRPLRMDDPATATTLLAGFPRKYWPETHRILDRLRHDPTWEPFIERKAVPHEKTLHNLPEPDYDETTFIGRKAEVDKLLRLLHERRHSVITLTGEGGIGKTALALDVAYRLLDSNKNPYEVILWVSLKTEQLTAYGVQELRDAITAIDGTVVSIGRSIDADFSGTLAELNEALRDVDALVIIDNLETVNGDEVLEMVDQLPTSVSYLFTSRVGLGQLERRLPLPPLEDQEAKLLFRKFAGARNQRNLSGLSEEAIKNVVEQLRWSPLAIKWYVLSSEAGRVPLDVLRDQSALLRFCVQNVYDRLSEMSQAILSVLRALDRSVGFDEFSILTDIGVDDLRASTQDLARGALVVVEAPVAGAIASKLGLTPTARAFLERPDHSGSFIKEVLKRERDFKAALENAEGAAKGIDRSRYLARDEADHATVYLLQAAVRLARLSKWQEAEEKITRAKEFNPEFSEVYRASGYIEYLEGHFEAAHSDYKSAVFYAQDNESDAVANYVLADLLAGSLKSAQLAVEYARYAYEAKPCGDTRHLLGKILIWAGDFEAGQIFLEQAREQLRGSQRLRATTVLADSWGRWALQAFRVKDYDAALEKAVAGFHLASGELKTNKSDVRLPDVMADCLTTGLRCLTRMGMHASSHHRQAIARTLRQFNEWAPKISDRKRAYLRDALDAGQPSLSSMPTISPLVESALRQM